MSVKIFPNATRPGHTAGPQLCIPIDRLYNECMDQNIRDIIDSLSFIKENMATKDELAEVKEDLAALRTELKNDIFVVRTELREFRDEVRAELRSIRLELDALKEKVENVTGFRKEIDYALERIAGIEKHLGINKRVAA